MSNLHTLLEISSSRHTHLCPRQVLGVYMGQTGAAALGLALPRKDKGLLIILETDGCFADGIEVATGCSVGHRTLRVEDYGKIAATFIEVKTERALRLAPRANVRDRAWKYAPDEHRHYFAQLEGYQRMPVDELFTFQDVTLTKSLREILSRPGLRVQCDVCGEEIINQREIYQDQRTLCRGCAPHAYYQPVPTAAEVWSGLLTVTTQG